MSVELAVMLVGLVLLAVWVMRRKPRRERYHLRPSRPARGRKASLGELAAHTILWFW